MKNFREWLGTIVIVLSVAALAFVGWKIVGNKEASSDDFQFVYSSLLPLVGTWVGVVLAFYFGKENYEAASKRYENLIDKLTPELLDNVKVDQIMIARKTMVVKKWMDIKEEKVSEIIKFLVNVDKSRLPILDNNGKVKYIVHSSLLTKPSTDAANNIQPSDTSIKMEDFVKKYKNTYVDTIVKVDSGTILEEVRKQMSKDDGIQDVFVMDSNGNLIGWLTNTLILRYINSNR